jgi:hypothetical protein
MKQRISVNEIKWNGLPDGATGVVWDETDWTECRAHVEYGGWMGEIDDDHEDGTVLYDENVACDLCREADEIAEANLGRAGL